MGNKNSSISVQQGCPAFLALTHLLFGGWILSVSRTGVPVQVPRELSRGLYSKVFVSDPRILGTEAEFAASLRARWSALNETETTWDFVCGNVEKTATLSAGDILRQHSAEATFRRVGGSTHVGVDLYLMRTTQKVALRICTSRSLQVCEPIPAHAKIAPSLLLHGLGDADGQSLARFMEITVSTVNHGEHSHSKTVERVVAAVKRVVSDARKHGYPKTLLERVRAEGASQHILTCVAAAKYELLNSNIQVLVDEQHASGSEVVLRVDRVLSVTLALQIALDVNDVEWIEERESYTTDNRVAAKQIQGATTYVDRFVWKAGINGSGQTGGISDSYLDQSSCFFRGKITAYITDLSNDNAGKSICSHGTHTAGTMLGRSEEIGSLNGVAFDSKLVFVSLAGSGENEIETPPSLLTLFSRFKLRGAKIVSNSWSTKTSNAKAHYSRHSMQLDSYLYANPDMLILFSGGNCGRRGEKTIGRPSQAKNLVTVGATKNELGSHGLILAEYSSRGPAEDGRVKPDVLGPGGDISSPVFSARAGVGGKTCKVCGLSGTSMATPAVAGAAILMRQYLMDGYYPGGVPNATNRFEPKGFLLKAMLIHSGENLVEHSNGTTECTDANQQGWGAVNLANILQFRDSTPPKPRNPMFKGIEYRHGDCLYLDQLGRLHTGGSKAYMVTLYPNPNFGESVQLKVSLAWYDYEAPINSRHALINELKLSVETFSAKGEMNRRSFHNGIDNVGVMYVLIDGKDAPRVRITVEAMYVFDLTFLVKPQPYGLVITARGATCAVGCIANSDVTSNENPNEAVDFAFLNTTMISLYACTGLLLLGIGSATRFQLCTRRPLLATQPSPLQRIIDGLLMLSVGGAYSLRMLWIGFIPVHATVVGLYILLYWLLSMVLAFSSRRFFSNTCRWNYCYGSFHSWMNFMVVLNIYLYWFFPLFGRNQPWYSEGVARILEPAVHSSIVIFCVLNAIRSTFYHRVPS